MLAIKQGHYISVTPLSYFSAVNELAIKIKMSRIGGIKRALAAEEIIDFIILVFALGNSFYNLFMIDKAAVHRSKIAEIIKRTY